MPSNDFEQRMKARLSNAEFPASPELWDRIAGDLTSIPWWKDKRWLAAAMLMVLAGIGGFLLQTYRDFNRVEVATQSTKDTIIDPLATQESGAVANSGTRSTWVQGSQDEENTQKGIGKEIDTPVSDTDDKTSQGEQVEPSSIESTQTILPVESEMLEASENQRETQKLIAGNNRQEAEQELQVGTLSPIQIEDSSWLHFYSTSIGESTVAPIASGRPGHYRKSRFHISLYANPTLAWYTSTNFRVNQDRSETDAPTTDLETEFINQTVLYDITYSRNGIEAGIDLSYDINDHWQISSGAGIFRSGAHQLTGITLQPIWNDFNNQQFERMKLQEVEVANTSFHTTQLLIPVAGSYTLNRGRGQWVVSLGLTMCADISGEDFQDVQQSGSNEASNEEALFATQNTNLQATAQLRYQYSLRPGLSIYAGPVQSYGLTPLYETATGESIFLNRLGIRVGILFDE